MLDNLAGVDSDVKCSLVKVQYRERSASERSEQVKLDLSVQIVALAPEPLMRLLVYNNNNVSRFDSRRLVALARKSNGLTALHALVDVHLEELALRNNLLADANLAAVLLVDNLARTVALSARLLDLLEHRPHLAQHHLHTTTLAAATLAHRALFTALSATLSADDVSSERELRELALVQILERRADTVVQVFAFSWTLAA